MVSFVDRVVLHAAGGSGGHGCASVRREKFVPLGGPDGGNGGHGGSVVLAVDPAVASLLDLHHRPHRRAGSGRPGQGSFRAGADGDDVVVGVPDGTTVTGADGTVLADLVGPGAQVVVAPGGRGGLGNAALASPRRRAPGFALLGEPGEARDVVCELKSLADVGLVGLPSAGKSSLVSVVSAARPKVAEYPFTTLVPNLGVVRAGDVTFTVADVPGLVPGASEGRGLGLEFLRHVERCSVLVHVLDCATLEPHRDPLSDLDAIEAELEAFGGLADRERLVVLNKVDVPEARELAELVTPDLRARGFEVFPLSAVSREGLPPLLYALAARVAAARDAVPDAAPERPVVRPVPVDDAGFRVAVAEAHDDDGRPVHVVHGERPARWVRQTDFANDEAVGYLADRLSRLGVEEELRRLGVQPGEPVSVGGVVFDWVPSRPGEDEPTLGPRGADPRLDPGGRAGADERLAAKRRRRASRHADLADDAARDAAELDDRVVALDGSDDSAGSDISDSGAGDDGSAGTADADDRGPRERR